MNKGTKNELADKVIAVLKTEGLTLKECQTILGRAYVMVRKAKLEEKS